MTYNCIFEFDERFDNKCGSQFFHIFMTIRWNRSTVLAQLPYYKSFKMSILFFIKLHINYPYIINLEFYPFRSLADFKTKYI